MSGSSQFGKLYTAVLVQKLYQAGLVRRVVDIGAGSGTYSELLRGHMPDCDWHAVEVWQPSVITAVADLILANTADKTCAVASSGIQGLTNFLRGDADCYNAQQHDTDNKYADDETPLSFGF